jgi:hypothetical protein
MANTGGLRALAVFRRSERSEQTRLQGEKQAVGIREILGRSQTMLAPENDELTMDLRPHALAIRWKEFR